MVPCGAAEEVRMYAILVGATLGLLCAQVALVILMVVVGLRGNAARARALAMAVIALGPIVGVLACVAAAIGGKS